LNILSAEIDSLSWIADFFVEYFLPDVLSAIYVMLTELNGCHRELSSDVLIVITYLLKGSFFAGDLCYCHSSTRGKKINCTEALPVRQRQFRQGAVVRFTCGFIF